MRNILHKSLVALVGTSVNFRANVTASLKDLYRILGCRLVAYLRNSQFYTTGIELGVSMFDLHPSFVAHDVKQCAPLLDWIQKVSIDEQ